MSEVKMSLEEECSSPSMFSDFDAGTNVSIAGTSEETNSTSSSFVETGIASGDPEWKGVSMDEILKNCGPYNWQHLPPIQPSPSHTILFLLPLPNRGSPKPYPTYKVDKWNQGFVRLPHSSHSLYPNDPSNESSGFRRRWEVIQEALLQNFVSSHELEVAILSYNHKYAGRWDFSALHYFFEEYIDEEETKMCFAALIPKMVQLALQLPELITGSIPLLRQYSNASISFSQLQVACLLANAFFCTFPRRNSTNPQSEYANFPFINFNKLFSSFREDKQTRHKCVMEKLRSIFHYFKRVTSKAPEGTITIQRKYIPKKECPRWDRQTGNLPLLHITSRGTIESEGAGFLQVDFANKYLGGGVLNYGCVQEEIRFVICPELMVTMLVTEALDETEALIINGVERYSLYKGYSNNFKWIGDYVDETPRDSSGRRKTCVVAIDALYFKYPNTQFSAKNIIRELNKAYVGFSSDVMSGSLPAIATGNWGCGAYRGDPQLKVLVQLMAAAVADRSLMYFTFGDTQLRDNIAEMYWHLVRHNIDISRLFALICEYQGIKPEKRSDFYHFLFNRSKIKPMTHYFSKTFTEDKTDVKVADKNTKEKTQFNDDFKKHASFAKLQEEGVEKKIEHWLESVAENDNTAVEDDVNDNKNKKYDQNIWDFTEEEVRSNKSAGIESTKSSSDTNSSDSKIEVVESSLKRKKQTFAELFGEKSYNDNPTKKKISGLEIFNKLILEEKDNCNEINVPMEVEIVKTKSSELLASTVKTKLEEKSKIEESSTKTSQQTKIHDFFKRKEKK